MTGPGRRPSVVDSIQTTDSYIRGAGRSFLVQLYTALRSLKLYPLENSQVQKSLDDLVTVVNEILAGEHEIEVRITGEFIFVNQTRLRLDLDNYASFSHILSVLKAVGVGLVRAVEGADRREWTSFLSLVLTMSSRESANRFFDLSNRLNEAGVTHIAIEPPIESEVSEEEEEKAKEQAKRTYQRSVAVTKEVINSVRMGRTASVKKVKRAVQSIVDQVLPSAAELLAGMTMLGLGGSILLVALCRNSA